jgi:hypothetical protein
MTTIRNIFGLGVTALAIITAPVLAAENIAQTAGDIYPRCSRTVNDHCTNTEGKSAHMGLNRNAAGHTHGKHNAGHNRKRHQSF